MNGAVGHAIHQLKRGKLEVVVAECQQPTTSAAAPECSRVLQMSSSCSTVMFSQPRQNEDHFWGQHLSAVVAFAALLAATAVTGAGAGSAAPSAAAAAALRLPIARAFARRRSCLEALSRCCDGGGDRGAGRGGMLTSAE